jgi:hypothetical protein
VRAPQRNDIPGADLGHHGEECSFDAIVRKYDLASANPAIGHLARIVRGADTANYDLTPESRGLLAIAQGFSLPYADDHAQLAAELPVYDALYVWCQRQALTDRYPLDWSERMTDDKTVLFVCLHGAGMSRMAASYFEQSAPAGWGAVSAGLEPAETLGQTAARLLSGTSAVAFLDLAPPRAISAVPHPERMIALRNPAIQFELEGAEMWNLAHVDGEPQRDEIRARVDALVRTLARDSIAIN